MSDDDVREAGAVSEQEEIYAQAARQCRRPREATCTCGHIKPYGYGPHICVGNEPDDAEDPPSDAELADQ